MNWRRLGFVLVVSGALAPGGVAARRDDRGQQTVRDQPAQRAGVGKGAITGRVINAVTGDPVADAVVLTVGGDSVSIRVGQTGGDGQFVLAGIPAGKFVLSASKPPFVGGIYGATKPGRPGTPVVLTDGQIVTGLELRLWPGSVITGTVLDAQGEPAPGVAIQLQSLSGQAGALSPLMAQLGAAQGAATDDRGMYRVYGVAPGDYVVLARAPPGAGQARPVTPEEIADGLRLLREPPSPAARSRAERPPDAPSPPPQARGPSGGPAYAPVYFPGTADLSRAARVTMGMGEERAGVDIRMELVPLARVDGAVFTPDGNPAGGVQVSLWRPTADLQALVLGGPSVRSTPVGQFVIRNVSPGQYRLTARTGGGSGAPVLWAGQDLTVTGQDVAGLVLQLRPGLTITGRVAVHATRLAPPADFSTMRVAAMPLSAPRDQMTMLLGAGAIIGGGATVSADGAFDLGGLVPGAYLLTGAVAGNDPGSLLSWRVSSVTIDGRETLDVPVELRPEAAPKNVVVTFTDVVQELSGVLSDASGRPLTASTVILASSDRRHWYPDSRRVLTVRPGTDGSYAFSGPLSPAAGEYFLSVVTDLDPGQQYDPAFLEALAAAGAVKVTLAPGERKTQDLRTR